MSYITINLLVDRVPAPLPKKIRSLTRYVKKYSNHFGLMIVGSGYGVRYFVDRKKTEEFLKGFDPKFKIK